jgi:hypothetical protein
MKVFEFIGIFVVVYFIISMMPVIFGMCVY